MPAVQTQATSHCQCSAIIRNFPTRQTPKSPKTSAQLPVHRPFLTRANRKVVNRDVQPPKAPSWRREVFRQSAMLRSPRPQASTAQVPTNARRRARMTRRSVVRTGAGMNVMRALRRVKKYLMNPPQPFRRRMLTRPSPKHHSARWRFETPNLCAAHPASRPERLDLAGLKHFRIVADDRLNFAYGDARTQILPSAACGCHLRPFRVKSVTNMNSIGRDDTRAQLP